MSKLVILGSSSALADKSRQNAFLLAQTYSRTVLIDCGNSPLQQLQRADISPLDLTDLIITHFHPDHVGAAPLLLMDLWLMGRTAPLHIHGLAHALDRLQAMMALYDWDTWPNFYPVIFHRAPETGMGVLIDADDLRVSGLLVEHVIPCLGLRLEFLADGKTVAYSSDTKPSAAAVRLGQGCDILIHEATGETTGHSSAAQAAVIASRAGAKKLCLIHYSGVGDVKSLLAQAEQNFSGPVVLAQDLMRLQLS